MTREKSFRVAWGDPALTGSIEAGDFALPVGTVAFLLTDVEGSTRAWEAEPDAMSAAMDRHNAILDAAVSAHGGVCPRAQGEGDSIVAAFARPSDAVLAAHDAQAALVSESWPTSSPLRVRMAVHAGEARFVEDGSYAGQAIIRTARLRAIAHGGQVLVSAPARDLTIDHLGDRVAFRDLGEHRLRDLARPERVYQLEGPGLLDDFDQLRSLDSHPHNLPIQLSTFVGRIDEIATVAGLLRAHRLVTIAGAGGSGKTRLAQHVAAEVLDRFADGVWWVELAELNDPTILPATISTIVGVKGEMGDGAVGALADRIGDRRVLMVLDNCEHLVGPVAELVDRVLRRCASVSVLATSREPLEVSGEVAWRIPPLGIPSEAERVPVGAISQFEGVRLFMDRAQSVRPNFHLSDDNAPYVAAICTRLDGIPLAIELAAARCRSLTPERILNGLADVFQLLTGGGRTALPRQQTLEASIAWSHDLLAPDEQVLLRRLAVFSGGCTLDDAELVVADGVIGAGIVLDLLDRLVSQSLVYLDDNDAVPRYRLLETVRQYAAQRLEQADEAGAVRSRHADRFVKVAEEIAVAVEGAGDLAAYARVVSERDNLDAALGTLASGGRWDEHARLVLSAAWARMVTDPLHNIRDLSVALDGTLPESPMAARLLATRAMARSMNFEMFGAILDAQSALPVAEAHCDDKSLGRAKFVLGFLLAFTDADAADQMLASAAEHLAESDPFGSVYAAGMRASVAINWRGDMVVGWEQMMLAEEAAEAIGSAYLSSFMDSYVAGTLCIQGRFREAVGRLEKVERGFAELARAARLPLAYLYRNSFAGNVALFDRVWVGASGAGPLDMSEVTQILEAGRAEGQLYLSIMVGMIAAIGRYVSGDCAGACADLQAIADQADAVGVTLLGAVAKILCAPVLDELGDAAGARALLAATEPVAEACTCLFNLARLHHRAGAFAMADGEPAEAERRGHECLSLARTHDFYWEGAVALELLAEVAAATGSPVEAVRLAAAAARIRVDQISNIQFLRDRERLATALSACREALGADAYDVAWAQGSALSLADATEYAQRARGERKRPTLGWESLTPTERLVVDQVQVGLTNPQIAAKLLMSRDTVKTHLSHVFTKLDVKSRSELAATATRRSDRREDR